MAEVKIVSEDSIAKAAEDSPATTTSPPAAAGPGKEEKGAPIDAAAEAGPTADAAKAAPKVSDEDQLRERLRAREKELEDFQERFLRLAADFDNFKKRAFKERAEAAKYAHENLAKQLLDGIDNLERARAHGETADKDALLAGVGLVESIFLQSLERFGIKRFSALGQPFDPAFHEAVQEVVAADVPAGSVMFELQKGYTYHDRLLRPSRVVLSKAPDKEAELVPASIDVEIDLEADAPKDTGTIQS